MWMCTECSRGKKNRFFFSFFVVVENVRGVIELESRVVEGFNIN